MAYKIITATSPSSLQALILAEIGAGNSPVGAPTLAQSVEYPVTYTFAQAVIEGDTSVTDYKVLMDYAPDKLAAQVNAAIDGKTLFSGVIVLNTDPRQDVRKLTYVQVLGVTSGASVPAHTHAAADIASGTIAVARLPLADGATKGIIGQGSGLTIADGVASVP